MVLESEVDGANATSRLRIEVLVIIITRVMNITMKIIIIAWSGVELEESEWICCVNWTELGKRLKLSFMKIIIVALHHDHYRCQHHHHCIIIIIIVIILWEETKAWHKIIITFALSKEKLSSSSESDDDHHLRAMIIII